MNQISFRKLSAVISLGFFSQMLVADRVIIFPTEFKRGDISYGSDIKAAYVQGKGYTVPIVTITKDLTEKYRKVASTMTLPHFTAVDATVNFLKIPKIQDADQDAIFSSIRDAIEEVATIDKSGVLLSGEKVYIYELPLSQIGITPQDFSNTTEDWRNVSPGELLSAAKGERTLDPLFRKKVSRELLDIAKDSEVQKVLANLEPSKEQPIKPGAGKKMEVVIIPSYIDQNNNIYIGFSKSRDGFLPIKSALVPLTNNSKDIAKDLLLQTFRQSSRNVIGKNLNPVLIATNENLINAKDGLYNQFVYQIEISKDVSNLDFSGTMMQPLNPFFYEKIATLKSAEPSTELKRLLANKNVAEYIGNLESKQEKIPKEPSNEQPIKTGEGGENVTTIENGQLETALITLKSQFLNLTGPLIQFAKP